MTPPCRRLVPLALLAALLAGPARAQTQSQSQTAIPAQAPDPALQKLLPQPPPTTLTVAVALGSPPDDFRDAQGNIVGWEIDILRGVAQSLGLQLELRPATFDTLIPGLQAHRFDAAVGQMGITDVREKIVDMVGTLIADEEFATLGSSDLKVASLQDLCGHSVATTRGSREMVFAANEQPRCAAAGKPPINAMAFNDGNGAAEAVMSGRADAFWLGSTAISYFVAQSHGRAKVVGSYTDRSYLGIALSKGSDLAKPVQAAVQHLIDDGTYARIVAKWGLEQGAEKTAPLDPTGTPN